MMIQGRRNWEAVYAHRLLAGLPEAQVCEAIRVVSRGLHLPIPTPGRQWTVEKLAVKVLEYLEDQEADRQYRALPRHNGHTEAEWEEIMAVLRECNRKALDRHIQSVVAFAWFYEARDAKDVIEEQQEAIAGQQRVIDSLLEYITELPLPGENP